MKLIENWRAVATKAASMWALYLGLVLLWMSDLIYSVWGIDTNPRLWMLASTVAFIWGIVGRLVDQGIDHSQTRRPALLALLILAIVVGFVFSGTPERIPLGEPEVSHAELEPREALVVPVISAGITEAQFLKVAFPLVSKWEGMRTEAYLDLVGVPTVCYGHTRGVKLTDSYTKAECKAMLGEELLEYRSKLHRYFTHETKADRLTPERDAAYGSLAFNVG
jgi:hypothetical protein